MHHTERSAVNSVTAGYPQAMTQVTDDGGIYSNYRMATIAPRR